MCDLFEYSSVIRGNHSYKDIFTSTIGKTLQSQRETDNDYDSYVVAIIENDTIVGHVPRTISVPCDLCPLNIIKEFVWTPLKLCPIINGVHHTLNFLLAATIPPVDITLDKLP